MEDVCFLDGLNQGVRGLCYEKDMGPCMDWQSASGFGLMEMEDGMTHL